MTRALAVRTCCVLALLCAVPAAIGRRIWDCLTDAAYYIRRDVREEWREFKHYWRNPPKKGERIT